MLPPMTCSRLFADANGDSQFEEIPIPMEAVQYAPPAPAVHLSAARAAQDIRWFRFPADWHDAAHPSPRRQLFVVLSGQVEGWTSSGETQVFGPGDCLLMEDTTGDGHGARPVNGEATALVIGLA